MPPYDSDSSRGEEESYTETNVLLGYASKEPTDDTISHLGGKPTWLDPSTPPSSGLVKCKICNDILVLLLQLNGDLPEAFPGHERRLYVLSCRRKTCRRKDGSVRVLRGTRISNSAVKENKERPKVDETPKPKSAMSLGDTLFGGKPSGSWGSANPFANNGVKTNPFATSSSTAARSNPFAAAGLPTLELASKPPQAPSDLPQTFASVLSLNNTQPKQTFGPVPPPEPFPPESQQPNPYPFYHLDADYEALDKAENVPIPQQTMTMDIDESGGSGAGKEDKDVYESTIDSTFQKFADRLSQNPEQVIRYEYKGQPLLYSKSDNVGKLLSGKGESTKVRTSGGGMERCGSCGAGRVFEVQLTPYAIIELEREEGVDGMEWGTLVVGVCERDCLPGGEKLGVGYVEEWVGVQWEEVGR